MTKNKQPTNKRSTTPSSADVKLNILATSKRPNIAYSEDFKLNIVKLCILNENTKSINQVALETNVPRSTVRKWVTIYKDAAMKLIEDAIPKKAPNITINNDLFAITQEIKQLKQGAAHNITALQNDVEVFKKDIVRCKLTQNETFKDIKEEVSDFKIELAAVINDLNCLHSANLENFNDINSNIKSSNVFFEKQLGEIKANMEKFQELVIDANSEKYEISKLEGNILKMALPIILKLINQIEDADD